MSHQRSFGLLAPIVVILLVALACAWSLSRAPATAVDTPTVPPLASISGTILLESEDPFLWIYARELNGGGVYAINPEAGANTYTIAGLPAGTYVVVGWFRPLGASGAYTSIDVAIAEGEVQMRACEFAMVHVHLEPGEEYAGADIGCWGGDFFRWAEWPALSR